MPARPLLVTAVVAGALLAGGTSALAAPPDPTPGRVVERTLPGPAALRSLGVHGLARAAEVNDMSRARLAQLLEDRTTRLVPNGHVFYADTAGTAEEPAGAPAPEAAYALDQTFALHSRPGSSRTIFLDFDGATVSGTWWNSQQNLAGTTVPAFSLDADRGSFSETERALVQEVHARVAEDFAPFDVDVTTEQPAGGALTRTSTTDQTYGTHVLFAPGTSVADALCGGTCSGIAWIKVFDRVVSSSAPGPAWVFPDVTNRAGWRLAEVASHEAGHTLGLRHDGTSSQGYYPGHTPWGPVMGSARYGLTQWSKGEYADASNPEDDLALIDQGGAPLVPDEHGDTPATSTSTVSATSPAQGVVGTATDRDVFRLEAGCAATVGVQTSSVGANLDARLRVLDAGGTVLAADDPAATQLASGVVTGTGASLTVPDHPSGALFVEVDGVGSGTPSTGYSDYGSVGRYRVTVSGCASGGTPTSTTGTTSTTDTAGARQVTADPEPTVTVPGTPSDVRAFRGARGGAVTAKVTWQAPLDDGGSPVTGYRVTALKVSWNGSVLRRTTSLRPASARAWAPRLTRGYYRFRVVAVNAVGDGMASPLTAKVRAR